MTTDTALHGCRVFVAEDEALISMVLEDMLDMLGCTVVGVATTIGEAHEMIDAEPFDLAILDVNLGRDSIYPIAERLDARGIPVLFATGSHRDSLPERFRHHQLLEKPYTFPSVEATLARAKMRGAAIRAE